MMQDIEESQQPLVPADQDCSASRTGTPIKGEVGHDVKPRVCTEPQPALEALSTSSQQAENRENECLGEAVAVSTHVGVRQELLPDPTPTSDPSKVCCHAEKHLHLPGIHLKKAEEEENTFHIYRSLGTRSRQLVCSENSNSDVSMLPSVVCFICNPGTISSVW